MTLVLDGVCLWLSFLAFVVTLMMHGAACDRRRAQRERPPYRVGDVVWEVEQFARYGPRIR